MKITGMKPHKVRKNHPNPQPLITFIQQKLLEAQKVYLNQEIRKKVHHLRAEKRIKHQRTGVNFFQFAKEYLDTLYSAGKIKV